MIPLNQTRIPALLQLNKLHEEYGKLLHFFPQLCRGSRTKVVLGGVLGLLVGYLPLAQTDLLIAIRLAWLWLPCGLAHDDYGLGTFGIEA